MNTTTYWYEGLSEYYHVMNLKIAVNEVEITQTKSWTSPTRTTTAFFSRQNSSGFSIKTQSESTKFCNLYIISDVKMPNHRWESCISVLTVFGFGSSIRCINDLAPKEKGLGQVNSAALIYTTTKKLEDLP